MSAYCNSYVQAKVTNLSVVDSEIYYRWRVPPLSAVNAPLPPFEFKAKEKFPHPDCYFTGSALELYSQKMLDVLMPFGIKHEMFDAEIRDEKSSKAILKERGYKVFRLLESQALIDSEKSIVADRKYFKTMVLDERPDLPAMLIEANYGVMTFIRQDLKEAIETAGITGCEILTLEQYSLRSRWLPYK